MSRPILSLCLILALARFAAAHPVPDSNHNRTIVLHLTPTAVLVDYRLELSGATAVLDLPRAEWAGLKDPRDFYPVYLRYFAPVLADNLVASLDGKPLRFACVFQRHQVVTDHLRFDYRFEAKWAPAGDAEHVFTFREANYDMDSVSKLLLSVAEPTGVSIRELKVPNPAKDEGEPLRNASATFTLDAEKPLALVKTGLPPDVEGERPGPDDEDDAAVLKVTAHGVAAAGRGTSADPQTLAAAKAGPVRRVAPSVPLPEPAREDGAPSPSDLVQLLLDSKLGIGLLLLLAAGVGAIHALTPGHGKTLVAAYLVGERGTFGHALLLGLVTTLTHTAAVLALAAVLWVCYPRGSSVPPGLQMSLSLVGGLIVAGLGLWLLTRRLAGRVDHVHLGGGHHHHHHDHGHWHGDHFHVHDGGTPPHDHAPLPADGVGWKPLIWLGISGGIVPCVEAIALLIAAIGRGQVWLGLPLLLAFSAGLASVLIGIGVAVVAARRNVDALWGESAGVKKAVRLLPLFSAVVVTALGLWLCFDSVRGMR